MKMQRIRRIFSKFTLNEYVILAFVTSTFISPYLQAALFLALPFFGFVTKQFTLFLPKKKSDWMIVSFALLAALSTFLFAKEGLVFSFQLKPIYLYLLSVGIIILVFDIFFISKVMTRRVFLIGLSTTALLSITSFIVALFQRIFEIFPDPVNRPGRVASVFFNENYYGMVIEFVVLICLFLFFETRDKRKKAFFSIAFAFNVAALWLCQSRMAFIIVAGAVLIFLFFNHKKLFYSFLILAVVFCLLLIRFPNLLPRFDTISSYFDFRLGIWKSAINAFFENPILGRGYFSYSSIWLESQESWQFQALHTHNLYIEVLLNFGIIGAFLLFGYSLIRIFSCFKTCKQEKSRNGVALIVTVCLAIFLHGLADTTIFWPQTGFFAIFLLISSDVYQHDSITKEEN